MNKGILLSLILGIFLFSLMLVSGATTLNVPVTNTNYTTITFNCTTTLPNALNVSIKYNATGGATGTTLGSIINTSAGQTTFTSSSISIEALADALTYNFTCTAYNTTSNLLSAGVSSVGIDNTAPTLATTTDQSTGHQRDIIGLNWSCTDATAGVSTTSIVLTANGDAGCTISGTTSWSTATGSQSLATTQTQCAGLYTVTSSCTDTASNSATDSDTFNIYYPEGGSAFLPTDNVVNPITKKSTSSKTIVWWIMGIVIFIILIVILSFLAISQSKKRR